MSILQKDYWPCPFCDKGLIEVMIRPPSYRHQRTYGAGKGSIFKKINEQVVITTQRCSNCEKIADEIEKEWRKKDLL